MMKKSISILLPFTILFFHCSNELVGQLMPKPAQTQTEPILLVGATVHTGTGEIIANGAVGFKKGKITYVGSLEGIGEQKADYKTKDVSGQHIYPGFILLNSLIGIEEIGGVPHSNDKLEEGDINPSLKTVFAFDTGSEHIPTLRFNGILHVESIRSGGLISGTSAVMEMDGWSWQEAILKEEAALHLHWPSSISTSYDKSTNTRNIKKNSSYDEKVMQLENLFSAAHSYKSIDGKRTNLKLEALQGLFEGKKVLAVHAEEPKEIIEGITFAKSHQVKNIVLVATYPVLSVKEFIKENKIPVVLPPTYDYPDHDGMDYDAYYSLPHLLSQEGITVALNHYGMLSTSRNLPFYAGMAVAFGMEKEEALKLITLNPAKILGVDDRIGSIAVGKDASIFVSRGDALDVQTNALSMAFIRGKEIVLDGAHQESYKRYSAKYGHGE
ncbi:amidohydrolase family protein [Flagellimonas meridianipacifica]|uniref:Imidazolonepropionase-like amidohydrolase n=1 Tax=Flagellimonas meridianipacifica TaxID=1080225 RepID=A0A2T0MEZ6_9FLAO|nr:amidohydrolase family protein [Allomuricauda pacifica]PRX56149.1 imidazolonepropionase-like amidohydrolase [Allomuricauda pacifica]